MLKKVIITKNEIAGLLQFATAEFNEGDVIEMHSHESMTEIFYLISGSLQLITNKVITIRSGDTFIILPLQKHSLMFLEPSKILYFNLSS